MKVKSCMHKDAQWVAPETPVKAVAKMMAEQDIGSIPVGENDRLIGMVTDRDIVVRGLADGKDVAAKSSEGSSKGEGGKSDSTSKSDSGAASSNSGSNAANAGSGSTAKSSD